MWQFDEPFEFAILTNEHVVSLGQYGVGGIECLITDLPYPQIDLWLDTDGRAFNWHEETDVAVVSILYDHWDIPDLNFIIGDLPFCAPRMPLGAPVKVIGYPAFAQEICPLTGMITFSRTITEGTISAYRKGLIEEIWLPYPNYFVTATIDTGNSGGIALSKDAGGLCILGIPTWLVRGRFAEQGVVQNIHNLFQDW